MSGAADNQASGIGARRVAAAFTALLLGLVTLQGSAWLMAVALIELFLRVFGGTPSSLPFVVFGSGRSTGAQSPANASPEDRSTDILLLATTLAGWVLAIWLSLPLPATAAFLLGFLAAAIEALTGRSVVGALRKRRDAGSEKTELTPTLLARMDAKLQRLVRSATQGRVARMRLLMVCVSGLLAVALGLGGLKLYARQLGIRTRSFHNDLNYWRPDPTLGYVNRAHIDEFNHFVLKDQTNERGFRRARETALPKSAGVKRIVAIGDSVTWGIGVDERHSFCGALEAGLSEHGDFEVINAGVIGYSAWQEWKFFEEHALPLEPDVVLINLCENDILPTHDPFGNLREVQTRYFERLLNDSDYELTADDRRWLRELILLQKGESVWDGLASAPEAMQRTARRVLVQLPYRRLAERCGEKGIRLICLLIPPDRYDPVFEDLVETLQPVIESAPIEALDFRELLSTDAKPPEPDAGLGFRQWLPFRLRDLENIRLHQRMEWVHRERHFIDSCHLSRRGHAVVAKEIHRLLSQDRR